MHVERHSDAQYEQKYAPHPRVFTWGGWSQMDASIAFSGMINICVCQLDMILIGFFWFKLMAQASDINELGSMKTRTEAGVAQLVERVALI